MFRQSLKHQSLVEEHLRHGDISSSLCDNLLASFSGCLELAEQMKHAGLQVGKLADCTLGPPEQRTKKVITEQKMKINN